MSRFSAALAAMLLATLPLTYAGAYLALVSAEPPPQLGGFGPWPRHPRYSVGGKYAEIVFRPLQSLDKHLRNRHWEFHDGDADDLPK